MTILMLIYALLLPTVTGLLLVSFFSMSDGRQTFLEKLFLGYGIGIGMITLEMFILGLFGLKYSVLLISSILIAVIIFLYYRISKSKVNFFAAVGLGHQDGVLGGFLKEKGSRLNKAFIVFLSGWIILKIIFVIHESVIWPVYDWDSLATWSSLAKFFSYERGLALTLTDDNFFGREYRAYYSYPLHVPLMQTWIFLCTGETHETFMKVGMPLYFVSMIGLIFFAVKRETSSLSALLPAFFLSSVPLLTYHAVTTYADLPLGYYSLAAMTCFWRYIDSAEDGNRGSNGALILMTASILLGMWTKIEGLFFTAAFAISLSLFLLLNKRPFKKFLFYLIPVVIMIATWSIFLYALNLKLDFSKGKFAAGFHLKALPMIWDQIMSSGNFNVVFFFLFIISLIAWKRILGTHIKYILIILFSVMAMFVYVYLKSDYHWAVDPASINRNILTFIPTMYYVAALTAIRALRTAKET